MKLLLLTLSLSLGIAAEDEKKTTPKQNVAGKSGTKKGGDNPSYAVFPSSAKEGTAQGSASTNRKAGPKQTSNVLDEGNKPRKQAKQARKKESPK